MQFAVMKSKRDQGRPCSVQCLGRGFRLAVKVSGEVLSWLTGGRDVSHPPGVDDSRAGALRTQR